MQEARLCYHTMEISSKADEKCFPEFFTLIDEGQHQELSVSASKLKGRMEFKNLECSINYFDVRGVGSSRGKGKSALAVL